MDITEAEAVYDAAYLAYVEAITKAEAAYDVATSVYIEARAIAERTEVKTN